MYQQLKIKEGEKLPKKGVLSFAIVAVRSLIRSLQISRFRNPTHTDIATYGHMDKPRPLPLKCSAYLHNGGIWHYPSK